MKKHLNLVRAGVVKHPSELPLSLPLLYGVETKRVNEAVWNNPDKFPEDFTFELGSEEQASLRSKTSTLGKGKGRHRKYPPKAFTEQGVYMLATILKTSREQNALCQ